MKIENIDYCIGTGYGRVNVPMAQQSITEISCHARGANFMYGPEVRTVMDMGGQDCKAINVDDRGKVLNFMMNDKCAAGTGPRDGSLCRPDQGPGLGDWSPFLSRSRKSLL